MYKKLVNEARLTVQLSAVTPLLIKSGEANALNPALPDMCFVRCKHDGEETVYMPGSSLKGVFRSRYEQFVGQLRNKQWEPCKLFVWGHSCAGKINNKIKYEKGKKWGNGTERYQASCPACRLFGSLSLGGRIQFTDAYPVSKPVIGTRNGVGIDRVTGASASGALFDFEVVESGTFKFNIKFINFARYQLALILAILEDVDDGFTAFGMGTSRGNGIMRLADEEPVKLVYRYFRNKNDDGQNGEFFCGYSKDDRGGEIKMEHSLLAAEYRVKGMEEIKKVLAIDSKESLVDAIEKEKWDDVLVHPNNQNKNAGGNRRDGQ